jgi:hypothetical protein
MAETLLSPGVLARENDQTFLSQQPIQAGAAILGPTVKGPVGIPTIVTSYSDYQGTFGAIIESGSGEYTYFTSVAAYNYFQQGGDSLLVTRIVSGSYTSATSETIQNSDTSASFTLETISEGSTQNSSGSLGTKGQLANGTRENIRWEVVSPNTSSGTFGLLVRRGDDITTQKTILETWADVSLDPNASNYISRVIGDQKQTIRTDGSTYYTQMSGSFANASRFVRVSSVGTPTLNWFDNAGSAKTEYTSSIPLAGSGSFKSATGTDFGNGTVTNFNGDINSTNSQGLVSTNYDTSIALLANKDEYKYNLIVAPGLYREDYSSQITSIIDNTQTRGDAIAIVDMVNYADTISGVTTQAIGVDSSYAATYWPWVQTIDPDLGDQVWVPASTMIPGVYAFNDNSTEAWFAPAGLSRGGLSTVIRAERKLTNGNRDTLYNRNVNPIATFPNTGVVVFGQKTLQKKASALDRVNVRRLLIALKNYISQVADNLVFEQNTTGTRNNFLGQVNPYLESVQQRQGLYAFKVVMDESNNTPDVIDRNQLVGQIYIQPTRTAEFIYLDFNILPTGATFPA